MKHKTHQLWHHMHHLQRRTQLPLPLASSCRCSICHLATSNADQYPGGKYEKNKTCVCKIPYMPRPKCGHARFMLKINKNLQKTPILHAHISTRTSYRYTVYINLIKIKIVLIINQSCYRSIIVLFSNLTLIQ